MTENHMVIPHPSDPFYQPEPEERTVDIPITYEAALAMIAREAEEPEAVWVEIDNAIEAALGKHWVIVSGVPIENGVRITAREEV